MLPWCTTGSQPDLLSVLIPKSAVFFQAGIWPIGHPPNWSIGTLQYPYWVMQTSSSTPLPGVDDRRVFYPPYETEPPPDSAGSSGLAGHPAPDGNVGVPGSEREVQCRTAAPNIWSTERDPGQRGFRQRGRRGQRDAGEHPDQYGRDQSGHHSGQCELSELYDQWVEFADHAGGGAEHELQYCFPAAGGGRCDGEPGTDQHGCEHGSECAAGGDGDRDGSVVDQPEQLQFRNGGGGQQRDADGNVAEYGRGESDDLAGDGDGSWFQRDGTEPAVDVGAGAGHDVWSEVCAYGGRGGDGAGFAELQWIEQYGGYRAVGNGDGAGGGDGVADEHDVCKYYGGADVEPDGDDHEHWRHEPDDFCGRGIGDGVQCIWDYAAGDVDGGTEYDVHGEVCAGVGGHVQRDSDGNVGRVEPEPGDRVERDGDCGGGGTDGDADEFDVHEYHGGAELEPDGDDQEHGRDECDDNGGGSNRNRIQCFGDHAAGDVDGGTEHDVHGEVCAGVGRLVQWDGDGDVKRFQPQPGNPAERDGSYGGGYRS